MKAFTIEKNEFLKKDVKGYYCTDYIAYERRSEVKNYPMFLLTLKNDPNKDWWASKLKSAEKNLLDLILNNLPKISDEVKLKPLTVCVIPRSKADNTYRSDQLLFKETIKNAVNQLGINFINGTGFIARHTNTKTTHLRKPIKGFINDGLIPYPGITKDTCHISEKIIGKDILLIDDIYTKGINIDEDAIQALIDNGANSVLFYAIGKTI
ncbi:phosphoribosyltransferase [Cellulophaga baltica]|uniref:Amidophosphoribosyltransferase n=1 Tax=Cellulophaga baltica TaxID=76594 RepID=A0A1G7FIQ1_9FLAO|nr:phosphoribosyltransferase [Cellulophaga baltica]SDE75761.1 hypothetical protein SAMN04487992_103291 [Cellulophaga baltica]